MNKELRDKMNFLQGQIAAFGSIVVDGSHFDLWESIQEQYESIMREILEKELTC